MPLTPLPKRLAHRLYQGHERRFERTAVTPAIERISEFEVVLRRADDGSWSRWTITPSPDGAKIQCTGDSSKPAGTQAP